MKYTVEELAKSVEGKVVGDGSVEITETRGLDQAAPQAISFAIGEYCEHGRAKQSRRCHCRSTVGRCEHSSNCSS